MTTNQSNQSNQSIQSGRGTGRLAALARPWRGVGPFLFTAYHLDAYPAGTETMAPATPSDGSWSMYHGTDVPGFPAHPHRGFETITIVNQGYVDHADSTGASARYGAGDVQWVTAGGGVSHAEMFPLLNTEADNTFELYQVWLNLPAKDKGVPAEFSMQWNEDIPVVRSEGATVKVIAGSFGDATALAPPKHSWAADPSSDLALWLVTLEPGAEIRLPDVGTDTTERMLYVHGARAVIDIDGVQVGETQAFEQTGRGELVLRAGDAGAKVLLLQGVPINEPVVAHGPFVMNTEAEIVQAFEEYRATEFGGWPWPSTAMVHPRETPRFAKYGDGREERPDAE